MRPADVWREAASLLEALAATEAHDGAPDSMTRAGALFSAARILAGRAASPGRIQPPVRAYLSDATPEIEVIPSSDAMRSGLWVVDDDPTDPGA